MNMAGMQNTDSSSRKTGDTMTPRADAMVHGIRSLIPPWKAIYSPVCLK